MTLLVQSGGLRFLAYRIMGSSSWIDLSTPPTSATIGLMNPIRTGWIFPIPMHLVDQVKQNLNMDVRLGVLEKVEGQNNHEMYVTYDYCIKKMWKSLYIHRLYEVEQRV